MRAKLLLSFAVYIGASFLLSCSSDKTNVQLLNDLNKGLEENNQRLAFSNDNMMEALQMKADDLRSGERAKTWLPIAKKTRGLSSRLVAYLDSIQNLIADTIGKGLSTNDIFVSSGIGRELNRRLVDYRTQLFKSIPDLENQHSEIIDSFLFSNNAFLSGEQYQEKNFMNLDRHEAISALTLLQNKLLTVENISVSFCNEQFTYHDHYYDTFEAIVAQNTKILEGGDELEITAALGVISRSKIPTFRINDQVIPLNERGIVVQKMKTPQKAGNYNVPVEISYIDQHGKEQTRTFNVEYRVVKAIQ